MGVTAEAENPAGWALGVVVSFSLLREYQTRTGKMHACTARLHELAENASKRGRSIFREGTLDRFRSLDEMAAALADRP